MLKVHHAPNTRAERIVWLLKEPQVPYGSPTTYLACTQVPRIAQGAGATLVWHPMLLGGVFKATGNASPVSVLAKGRRMNDDIPRWARRWGVPFTFTPHFVREALEEPTLQRP